MCKIFAGITGQQGMSHSWLSWKEQTKTKEVKNQNFLNWKTAASFNFHRIRKFWHATSHRKELNAQTELPQFVHVAASAPYHFQSQKVYYTDKDLLLFMKLV